MDSDSPARKRTKPDPEAALAAALDSVVGKLTATGVRMSAERAGILAAALRAAFEQGRAAA